MHNDTNLNPSQKYGKFRRKVPQDKFMKYFKWHQRLVKLFYNCLYFNAQTDFTDGDNICCEKNEVKFTSNLMVEID